MQVQFQNQNQSLFTVVTLQRGATSGHYRALPGTLASHNAADAAFARRQGVATMNMAASRPGLGGEVPSYSSLGSSAQSGFAGAGFSQSISSESDYNMGSA